MVVKTFRGQLADEGQDRIRLSTNDGKTGYRIVKFEAMPANPAGDNLEAILQIWKTKAAANNALAGAAADWRIDFSDNAMLAALYIEDYSATEHVFNKDSVIFDNEIFNQDLYITNVAPTSSNGINYYLELEVISLSDHDAEFTTLKDIRANA